MALNNSFGLYRLIIENAVEVISVLDSQGTIQFVSPSAMRALGYEPGELAGRNAFDLIHPEDRPIARAALQSVFAKPENAADKRFTCRIIKKDNSLVVTESTGRASVDADGEPVAVITSRELVADDARPRHSNSLTHGTTLETSLRNDDADASAVETRSAILNALPAHIALLDKSGTVVALNNAWKRLALSPAFQGDRFCRGCNYLDLCRAASGECENAAHNAADGIEAVLQGRLAHFELEYACESAPGLQWYRLVVTPLSDTTEGGAVVTHFNITDRKLAEQALQASEERHRQIVETVSEGIFILGTEGDIQFVNRQLTEMVGYEAEELIGRNFVDFVFPSDQPDASRRFFERKMGDGAQSEFRVRCKDGSELFILTSSVPMKTASGELSGLLGSAVDITERKRAEDALRREKLFSDLLLDSIPGVFYFFDGQGRYLRWNKTLETVTGYTSSEISRMRPLDFIPDEHKGEVENAIRKVMTEGSASIEAAILSKAGVSIPYHLNGSRLSIDGSEYLLGVGIDVSERLRLEEQFRQSQKMEAVGTLAGGVAHDFNNLLTAINGYCDLILRRLPRGDRTRHQVEEIKMAGTRAANLTRQLLAFSRKQILQPKILCINDVIADMGKLLPRLLGEDIELKLALDPHCGSIKADPGQLGQIIMNLAVNARDAMPAGGKLTIESKNVLLDQTYAQAHPTFKPGQYVMLAVADTGEGIDFETQKHIFEPFFTTKKVGKGTGLGLSTVYGIVKQSGGWIWVYSEKGLGSTFKIYLPRIQDHVNSNEHSRTTTKVEPGNETVLLVEDEELVRNLAREILEIAGYRVLVAQNGPGALALVDSGKEDIDIVITDVVMPGMSGRELVNRIKQILPGVKALFMSGYTANAIVSHGFLDEGTRFIQKPFSTTDLTGKVREVLDG